jgi:hypothetical protein
MALPVEVVMLEAKLYMLTFAGIVKAVVSIEASVGMMTNDLSSAQNLEVSKNAFSWMLVQRKECVRVTFPVMENSGMSSVWMTSLKVYFEMLVAKSSGHLMPVQEFVEILASLLTFARVGMSVTPSVVLKDFLRLTSVATSGIVAQYWNSLERLAGLVAR